MGVERKENEACPEAELNGGKMAKFRKKPVVVEAEQFRGELLRGMSLGKAEPYGLANQPGVQTLQGFMVAKVGDWISKGIRGEFYPCKPDIFAETYERVEDSPDGD